MSVAIRWPLRIFRTLIFALASFGVLAQPIPNKPIKIVVPFAAGGSIDILARAIARKLAEGRKQEVIVENRPGASGVLGFDLVAKSPPDGHVLVMGPTNFLIGNAGLYGKLPYDPVKDFEAVTLVAMTPYVLVVNSSVPAKSVKELIALAKSKPGQLTFSSSGGGSLPHLSGELFNSMAGVNISHIPYKGSGPAISDVWAGQITMTFGNPLAAVPQIKSGRVRALAVTSGARYPGLPDVPTIAESGLPGFEVSSRLGILAPAKTPREVIARLNTEIVKILAMRDVQELFSQQLAQPIGSTPEQFAAQIKEELPKWAKLAKLVGPEGGPGGGPSAVFPAPSLPVPQQPKAVLPPPKVAAAPPPPPAATAPPPTQSKTTAAPTPAAAASAAAASAASAPAAAAASPVAAAPTPPPVAPAPPPTSAEQRTTKPADGELRWNAWGENEIAPYLPVTRIEGKTNYLIRVHLAPFSYGSVDVGVASPPASKSIKATLKEWLRTLPPEQKTIELDALLIYDPSYFEHQPDARKRLTINLDRLRELDKGTIAIVRDPFPLLRKQAKQPFVLGETEFQLRTKPVLPTSEGGGAVAISLWDRSKQVPLDEISFELCARQTCKGVRSNSYGFDGFDALKVSAGEKALQPAAAIHLVELYRGGMFGVFRRKGDDAYYTWPLRASLASFQTLISSHLKLLRSANNTEAQRAIIGDALLGQFFPNSPDNPDGLAARRQFLTFAREQMKGKPYPRDELPAVFFRIAAFDSTEPSLWPLSLISIAHDGAVVGSAPTSDFLGRYFRIESPLTKQNYDPSTPCLDDWVVIGPANMGATLTARRQLNDRLVMDDGDKTVRALRVAGEPLPLIDNMDAFLTFIRGPVGSDNLLVSKRPTLLSVLSHHDSNAVYFDKTTTEVPSGSVRRIFSVPSAAILNGCGTGEFGASNFIEKLNAQGVHAAIATITEVEPAMAGDFLECFIQQVESAPAGGIAIGVAHTKALRCLEQNQKGRYGSRALFYSLLGNSGLKICKPRIAP